MKSREFTISLVAGQPQQVYVSGTYIRCLDGDEVQVQLGTRESLNNGTFPLSIGKGVEGVAFEVVELTSDTTQTVTMLAIEGGRYTDDSLIIGSDVSVNTKPAALTMGTPAAGVTATAGASTLLITANTGRRSVAVHNEGPDTVYVRPDNTTAKSAFPISAGGVLALDLTQALYVYNPGGSDSTVYTTELS
jgi:hypothetical protein